MELSSIISTAYKESAQKQKNLQLKQGQLVYGTVLEKENGKAIVKIGNHLLKANIEAQVNENNKYWFKVSQKEKDIQLQVMNHLHRSGARKSVHVETLLNDWGMKQTETNQKILSFFMKEGISVSKQLVEKVQSIVAKAPSLQEGLVSIKTMLSKGIPLTHTFFSMVMKTQQNASFFTDLSHFFQQIDQLSLSQDIKQMIKTLRQQMVVNGLDLVKEGPMNEKKVENALLFLIKEAHQMNNTSAQSMMNDLLKGLMLTKKEFGIISGSANPFQTLQTIAKNQNPPLSFKELSSQLEQLLKGIAKNQKLKQTLEKMLSGTFTERMEKGQNEKTIEKNMEKPLLFLIKEAYSSQNQEAKALLKQLLGQETFTKKEVEKIMTAQVPLKELAILLNKKNVSISSEKLERLFFQKVELVQQLSHILTKAPVDEAVQSMKRTIPLLGMQYEHDLLTFTADKEWMTKERLLKQLKPLLLNLQAQLQAGTEMQKTAEEFVNRFTGLQLLNVQNQPLLHLLFQFPIAFTNQIEQVTVQFEGKKKENKELDPDFCRILFYLQLEHLKETVVDVKIQNKIIGITVYNEKITEKLINSLTPMLKGALEEINYQLSYVQSVNHDQKIKNEWLDTVTDSVYQEVDIRI